MFCAKLNAKEYIVIIVNEFCSLIYALLRHFHAPHPISSRGGCGKGVFATTVALGSLVLHWVKVKASQSTIYPHPCWVTVVVTCSTRTTLWPCLLDYPSHGLNLDKVTSTLSSLTKRVSLFCSAIAFRLAIYSPRAPLDSPLTYWLPLPESLVRTTL